MSKACDDLLSCGQVKGISVEHAATGIVPFSFVAVKGVRMGVRPCTHAFQTWRGAVPVRKAALQIHFVFVSCAVALQGDEIRELKTSKADKATLQPHIDALIALKTGYKQAAGKAYVAPGATSNPSNAKQAKQPKAANKVPVEHNAGKKGVSGGKQAGGAKTGQTSRGLPSPPTAKGAVMEDGKPNLENLSQHLVAFSYVSGLSRPRYRYHVNPRDTIGTKLLSSGRLVDGKRQWVMIIHPSSIACKTLQPQVVVTTHCQSQD